MSIFPNWLGSYGVTEIKIVKEYIEVPVGGGFEPVSRITVTAKLIVKRKKKKIKIKVKRII